MKNAIVVLLFATASLAAWAAEEGANVSERITAIRTEAVRKQYFAIEKAKREYRTAFATTFQFADRIEVFLLDFSIGKDAKYKPKDGEPTFPIHEYEMETKILKTLKVPVKDIPKWCAAVTKTLTSDKVDARAGCHMPIHGMRIYAHGELLFETSTCWHCNNYSFEGKWETLTEDAGDLKTLLHDFMPIPKEEKARFERTYKLKAK